MRLLAEADGVDALDDVRHGDALGARGRRVLDRERASARVAEREHRQVRVAQPLVRRPDAGDRRRRAREAA